MKNQGVLRFLQLAVKGSKSEIWKVPRWFNVGYLGWNRTNKSFGHQVYAHIYSGAQFSNVDIFIDKLTVHT